MLGSAFLTDFMQVNYSESVFLKFIYLEWRTTALWNNTKTTTVVELLQSDYFTTLWIIASSVACGHTMRLCSGYHFITIAIPTHMFLGLWDFQWFFATNCTSQNSVLQNSGINFLFIREHGINTGMYWKAKCTSNVKHSRDMNCIETLAQVVVSSLTLSAWLEDLIL